MPGGCNSYMCFFISSRSGAFRLPYVNETIYINSNGKSIISVEILIEAQEELRSFDIIYPNFHASVFDYKDIYKDDAGDIVDKVTRQIYYPENEELEGEIHNYEVGELYEDSQAHKEVLLLLNSNVFTVVFEKSLEPKTRAWVSLIFYSPKASQTKSAFLQKRYITSPISGPLNTKRAFEQRHDEWVERNKQAKEYGWSLVYAEKIKNTLADLKSTIISTFNSDDNFDLKRWNISIIPQPNLSEFYAGRRDGNIKEVENMSKATGKWPPVSMICTLPVVGEFFASIHGKFGFLHNTLKYDFYYKRDEKGYEEEKKPIPKFRLNCNGVYVMPYVPLLAIAALLVALFI